LLTWIMMQLDVRRNPRPTEQNLLAQQKQCAPVLSPDSWVWSDAWAVQAMLHSDGELGSIVGIGDALNHAIFTYEELEHAFSILQRGGLLDARDGRFLLTDQFREKLESTVGAHCLAQRDAILRMLECTGTPPRPEQAAALARYDRGLYDQAVREYLAMWPKHRKEHGS